MSKVDHKPKKSSPPIELKVFAETNPEVRLIPFQTELLIYDPWDDDTLVLHFKPDEKEFLATLNQVRLPPKFSAIIHKDTNDYEFVYGYLKPTNHVIGRKFTIRYNGKSYACEFATGSERLRKIATKVATIAPASSTNYRNLIGISRHDASPDSTLISFWIRSVDLSEEEMVLMSRTLNFYMVFVDRHTPTMMVHEPTVKDEPDELTLVPPDEFPQELSARPIEPYLLSLWESGRTASLFQRFIHNYQIVEYAGFYYIKDEVSDQIQKILLRPDAINDIPQCARMILDTLVQDKTGDTTKRESVVIRCADINALWVLIEKQKTFFGKDSVFEGGLTVKAIVSTDTTKSAFRVETLWQALTTIRNALVHSRQEKQSHTIHPTTTNEQLLRPWLDLLAIIAAQVIVYNKK